MTGYRSQPYDPHRHDAGGFDSGEPALDEWLRQHAAGADARRTARTFVWTRPGQAGEALEPVIAYYSLTGHRLVRDDLPRKLGRGGPDEIPAVLLARLALDLRVQGQGLGGAVLADALGRVVEATSIVAARFLVVDALHERAATFYEHHGFTRIPDTLRLIQKISDIAAALTCHPGAAPSPPPTRSQHTSCTVPGADGPGSPVAHSGPSGRDAGVAAGPR